MKIAISATAATLDANVDPRFGRCPCFLIVETDTMDYEAVENPNVMLGGGAGIQSAQLIAKEGAKYALTGNCGPNAHQALSAAGIQIIVGCSGVVRDVVEQFKAGGINVAGAPNVVSHFGMAGTGQDQPFPPQQTPMRGGGGPGMGGGCGRGTGMGRGEGRGRGQGRGMGGKGRG